MRPGSLKEKRRFKRLDLTLPTRIKVTSKDGKEKVQEGITLNVSFNGAYIVNIDIKDVKPGDKINISLSVPRDETRDFPFSRIAGKARVIRVEKNGVALEFNNDVSRLFVAN